MVRSKHRYITVKIVPTKKNISDVSFKHVDLYSAVLSKVKKMHGDFGVASIKTGFVCKYCNEMTGVAILKMRRGSHKYVSTIIPFISEIKSENVLVHTIRTTATIHQAYRHLKIYQQKELERIWNSLDEQYRMQMKEKFENLHEVEKLLQSEHAVRSKK